ncbi:MAG: hypothetical protein HYY52_07740 [Candidatus Melainabacteria bacterium]|nr:hypothetical protein [Candidatus Melainabacteria bacterium]
MDGQSIANTGRALFNMASHELVNIQQKKLNKTATPQDMEREGELIYQALEGQKLADLGAALTAADIKIFKSKLQTLASV